MVVPKLLWAACLALPGQLPQTDGIISGLVVNASEGETPVAGAEVVLRIRLDGQFVPAAKTTADAEGRFRFERLLVGRNLDYLPGANRDEVHYPGPRIQLTSQRRHVNVKLSVCDSVTHPNPLVVRRHDILVRSEPGALNVTESMLVANPTSTCYVGQAAPGGAEPVTLRLGIPSDFERTTFHKEFFGRRFSLVSGKLVTGIPWTPGEQELKFTYVLRNAQKRRVWERPLDLPCSQVRVRVHTRKPKEVSCNLEPGPVERRRVRRQNGDVTEVTFESRGRTLPAGHVIRLELGQLALPWMAYGRWIALGALVGLIARASFVTIRRGRRAICRGHTGPQSAPAGSPSRSSGPTNSTLRQGGRAARRSRKRKAASRGAD